MTCLNSYAFGNVITNVELFSILKQSYRFLKPLQRNVFLGGSGVIVVLHSSLSFFVASTRLIRSGVGTIDSPDQSRQGFKQYDTSEVFEKVFQSTF